MFDYFYAGEILMSCTLGMFCCNLPIILYILNGKYGHSFLTEKNLYLTIQSHLNILYSYHPLNHYRIQPLWSALIATALSASGSIESKDSESIGIFLAWCCLSLNTYKGGNRNLDSCFQLLARRNLTCRRWGNFQFGDPALCA